ncbi:MAG: hypothetical protein ACE363_06940 [Alphaproteobacteria bacterium]
MPHLQARPIHLAILLWGIISVLTLTGRAEPIDRLVLTGPDDYIRLLRVEQVLETGSWSNPRLERVNPPTGISLHWSPLADAPLVAMTALASLFTDQKSAIRVALMVTPLLGLLLLFVIATWAGGWLFGTPGAWMAPVSVLFAEAVVGQLIPGRIDHHGIQVLLNFVLAISCIGIVRGPSRLWPLVAGLATGLTLAIGLESMPYVGAFFASLGLFWILGRDHIAQAAAVAAGSATAVSLILLYINDPEPQYFWQACDALSGVYVMMLALVAVGWGSLAALSSKVSNPWARTAAGGVAAGLILAVFGLVFPVCLGGPYGQIPEDVRAYWLEDVDEVQTAWALLTSDPRRFLALYLISLIGFTASVVYLIKKGWPKDPAIPVLGIFLVIALVIAQWQIRGSTFAATFAILAALPAFVWLYGWAETRFGGWRRWMILGLILLVLSPLSLGMALRSIDDVIRTSRTAMGCGLPENLEVLAGLEKGLVASSVPLGPMVLYFTEHDIVVAPYHRGIDALSKAGPLLTAQNEANARNTMAALEADYFLICDSDVAYGMRGRAGFGPFIGTLFEGADPAWLTPVPIENDQGLLLFRVDQNLNDGPS